MLEKLNNLRNVQSDKEKLKVINKNASLISMYASKDWRTLWKFLKPYKWLVAISTLLSFFVAIMEEIRLLLAIGFIRALVKPENDLLDAVTIPSMEFVVRPEWFGFNADRIGVLSVLSIILVGAVFITSVVKFCAMYLPKRLQLNLLRDVRREVLIKIFRRKLDFFSHAKSGELLFLTGAEASRFSRLISLSSQLLTFGVQVLIFTAMLFYFSWDLTFILMTSGLLYFFIHLPIDSGLKKRSTQSNLAQNHLSHFFHQIIYGIKMIKIGNLEKREKDRFSEEHKQFEDFEMGASVYMGLSKVGQEIILLAVIFISVVYFYAAKDFQELLKTPDEVLAYLMLLLRTMPAVFGLQSMRSGIIENYGPLSRVMNLVNSTEQLEDELVEKKKPFLIPPKIQNFQSINVSMDYPGRPNVVNNISLQFQSGTMTALVGASGSGKSSYLDMLSLIREVKQGDIQLNNVSIKDKNLANLKRCIGYMNQEPIIFHETVRGNVAYFKPDATEDEIWKALRLASAEEMVRNLPNELETGLGERGLSVSGGERQRIGLARVFLQNPLIFLLDEVTNALDYETEAKVYDGLRSLAENRIMVIAAHRLSAIIDFDQIVIFRKGVVAEKGTHQELMENKSYYYNLFMVQQENKSE